MAPPGAAAAAKEKGNQAFKLGDHPLAIAHYTTAIALDPSEFTYPLNRSQTYLKQGKWAEAEKDASTTLALMPGNAKALFRRGLARKERGNERGAREDFEAARAAGAGDEVVRELEKLSTGGSMQEPVVVKPQEVMSPSAPPPAPTPAPVPAPAPAPELTSATSPPSTSRLRAAITPTTSASSSSNDFMQEVSTRRTPKADSPAAKPSSFASKKEQREDRIAASPIAAAASPRPQASLPPPTVAAPPPLPTILPTAAAPSRPTPTFAPHIPALSTPTTALAFESSWSAYPSSRLSLLRSLNPSTLPALFGSSLTPDLLSSLVLTLSSTIPSHPNPSSTNPDLEWIMALLRGLTRVPRFGTVVGFLDEGEREGLRKVFALAREEVGRLEAVWEV